MITPKEFRKAWPVLKGQVKTLHVPWLDHMASAERDPFKVLVSCILSLRTKDEVTGAASQRLFGLAGSPGALAKLSVKNIEKAIYPVGFYRVKAGRIREISRVIIEKYHSRVPDSIDELLTLEGVGRKTANLVVTLGYDKPGICVDVHVHRICNRWGLVKTKTPHETEFALREILPVRYWKELNGMLVAFGQGICRPVSPLCSQCLIRTFCGRVGVQRSR
jgi:endonuclease III